MARQAKSAIVGLGITEMGKVYGRSGTSLALEAIHLALDDAGLKKEQLDGLLINAGISNAHRPQPAERRRLQEPAPAQPHERRRLTACQMVQYATMAVQNGMANYVACVFADTPLASPGALGAAYGSRAARSAPADERPPASPASPGSTLHYGYFGANIGYAMAARRHMAELRHHQRAARRHRRLPARLGRA